MALDYKTVQATAASQGSEIDAYCPECGRPWGEPTPERRRPSSPLPWRAVLLGVVGMYLAITFGPHAVRDYPRAVRDQAILQTTAECLARTGGQSYCAPSTPAPDGSTDLSLLVDQSAATRRKLVADLAATGSGVVFVLAGLGAPIRRWLQGRPPRRPLSALVALWGLAEVLLALGCLLVLALHVDLVALQLSQGRPLTRAALDRAADDVLTVISVITGT